MSAQPKQKRAAPKIALSNARPIKALPHTPTDGQSKASGTKTRSSAQAGRQNDHFYRPLPTQFRHDGFNYRQVARQGDAAIYEQTWNGGTRPVRYEVIRIRRRDGFTIHGRLVEPAEVYPNSEAWGTDGFTVTDKDRAFAKLRKLA